MNGSREEISAYENSILCLKREIENLHCDIQTKTLENEKITLKNNNKKLEIKDLKDDIMKKDYKIVQLEAKVKEQNKSNPFEKVARLEEELELIKAEKVRLKKCKKDGIKNKMVMFFLVFSEKFLFSDVFILLC